LLWIGSFISIIGGFLSIFRGRLTNDWSYYKYYFIYFSS
jgi:hypothetical protein